MDKKEKMAANLQKNLPSVKNRPIKIDKDIKDVKWDETMLNLSVS